MNRLGLPETDAPEWVKTSCLSNRDMEGQVNVKSCLLTGIKGILCQKLPN